nr:copia protein [Tanacetum cinerariifolium]
MDTLIYNILSTTCLELFMKHEMEKCDTVTTPIHTAKIDAGLLELAGCLDDYKSTYGGLQFLGDKLVSWSSKKQDCIAMSTTKAKYVSLPACCAQVIWMRTQLLDYGYLYNKIPIGTIELYFVETKYQLADLFTKALPRELSEYLVHRIDVPKDSRENRSEKPLTNDPAGASLLESTLEGKGFLRLQDWFGGSLMGFRSYVPCYRFSNASSIGYKDARSHEWRQILRHRCIKTKLITPNLICPLTYQLLWSSIGDSGPDMSFDRRLELQRKLHDINQMEAKDSFQKSKIKWAIQRDENSKFFHGIINKKHSQLAIREVFDNGLWCTDPGKVKEAFFNHFEARFKKHVS